MVFVFISIWTVLFIFILSPIDVIKEHHHVLFGLEIVITGTNCYLRRCGELSIKLLIRVIRRWAHKPRLDSFKKTTDTVGTFFLATLLVHLIKLHALLNELCDGGWGDHICFLPLLCPNVSQGICGCGNPSVRRCLRNGR